MMTKFEEYYPHDQKINMSIRNNGEIYALLFAGKIVAIGFDNGRDGDILFSVIDNSHARVRKGIDAFGSSDDPGVRLFYDKIKNRNLASKDKLPEPTTLIYQSGEYHLYQHAWWKRHKFELRRISDQNTFVFGSNDILVMSKKISELIGRNVTLR